MSPQTLALLQDLEAAAGRLNRRDDVGLLIEAAFVKGGRREALVEAAGIAPRLLGIDLAVTDPEKISTRTLEGAEKDILRFLTLVTEILQSAAPAERQRFKDVYVGASPAHLAALTPLCRDLAWFHRVVCQEGGGDA